MLIKTPADNADREVKKPERIYIVRQLPGQSWSPDQSRQRKGAARMNFKLNTVAIVGALVLIVGIVVFFIASMVFGGILMGVGLVVAIVGIVTSMKERPAG